MSEPDRPPQAATPAETPARSARRVLRSAATGALATLAESGTPLATLVTVATSGRGVPVMLLSDLALHTKNLKRDPRASLLLVAPGGEGGDPLAGARLSLVGEVRRDDGDAELRRRFLARQEEAAGYAGFRDFGFYRMDIAFGHLVAGFGRIVEVPAADLLVPEGECDEVLAAETSAIEHMNADHAEANGLYATRLLGQPAGDWRVTGIDPDGVDLRADALRARLEFPERIATAGALRKMLADLAREARSR